MRESTKIRIVHHPLEKFLVFAAARGFALKQEIVETNRRGAERVRLDYVRSGIEILGMNCFDNLRLS